MSRLLAAASVAGALLVAAAPAGASVDKPKDPSAETGNNIIAVLIGVKPLTAPLGSTKGSFIDASAVYGSD